MFSCGDEDPFEDQMQPADSQLNALDAYSSNHRSSLTSDLARNSNTRLTEYEVHYETLLKRSIKVWKEIQVEREEKGTVDQKKIATLKLFL